MHNNLLESKFDVVESRGRIPYPTIPAPAIPRGITLKNGDFIPYPPISAPPVPLAPPVAVPDIPQMDIVTRMAQDRKQAVFKFMNQCGVPPDGVSTVREWQIEIRYLEPAPVRVLQAAKILFDNGIRIVAFDVKTKTIDWTRHDKQKRHFVLSEGKGFAITITLRQIYQMMDMLKFPGVFSIQAMPQVLPLP